MDAENAVENARENGKENGCVGYSSVQQYTGSTSATVLYPYHAVAVLYCTGWYSPTVQPLLYYCFSLQFTVATVYLSPETET